MNRKDFLRSVGLTGIGLSMAPVKVFSKTMPEIGGCALIPAEIAGPFPLDLSANTFFLRQDITEDRTGTQHNLKIRIIGLEDCLPMQNVRVNIWHCDKDGNYSGYGSEKGTTYLRGYQMTDVEGAVDFVTIFPGWYPGRVCHFHIQIYVNENYAAISQFTFDPVVVDEVYAANPDEYIAGPDPLTPETDGAFSDGYDFQLASLTLSADKVSYDSFIEIAVQGSGTVGMGNNERQTSKIMTLGQNFPNPFQSATSIPFSLQTSAEVILQLWNVQGKQVHEERLGILSPGNHQKAINLLDVGLVQQNYLYQLIVIKDNRSYKTAKLMTASK